MKSPVLHHSSICVADVARAREFYETVLGFTTIPRPDFGFPGAWYGLGEGQLHLIQRDGLSHAPHRINPSDPHFAVTVDVPAMRAKLKALALEVLDAGDQMWVLDPDGNTVELRQNPKS
ncbi:MAG TPA: VOC family protein [Candidatus Kryptonia bacterium]|nr:VOC family protein [Candidatus Kryptonia bacterium]